MKESDLDNSSERSELVRGWSSSGNLLASVLTGLLIGLALDTWLGTRPVFVVTFVLVSAVGGFYMVRGAASTAIDAQAQEAIRIRDGL